MLLRLDVSDVFGKGALESCVCQTASLWSLCPIKRRASPTPPVWSDQVDLIRMDCLHDTILNRLTFNQITHSLCNCTKMKSATWPNCAPAFVFHEVQTVSQSAHESPNPLTVWPGGTWLAGMLSPIWSCATDPECSWWTCVLITEPGTLNGRAGDWWSTVDDNKW